MSGTAEVHNPVTKLKENLIQKVDDFSSGLVSKACENKVLGLSSVEVGLEKYSDGLNTSKSKSSWTRFQRMDFGLGS